MCDRIYLCYDCLWPICFPFGQKMHIGTGWYCWKRHGDKEEESLLDALSPFEIPKDVEQIADLVDQAVALYSEWKSDRKNRRVFTTMRRSLRQERSGIVHEFIRSVHRDSEVGPFLRQLTSTKEWLEWSQAAKRRGKARAG